MMKSALHPLRAAWSGLLLLSLPLSGCGNSAAGTSSTTLPPVRSTTAATASLDDDPQFLRLLDRINASAASALTGLPASHP